MKTFIVIGDGVTEKSNEGCIGGESPMVFGDYTGSLFDGIGHFTRAVVTVDAEAKSTASVEVRQCCRPHRISSRYFTNGGALHHGQRLTNIEAKLGVERH